MRLYHGQLFPRKQFTTTGHDCTAAAVHAFQSYLHPEGKRLRDASICMDFSLNIKKETAKLFTYLPLLKKMSSFVKLYPYLLNFQIFLAVLCGKILNFVKDTMSWKLLLGQHH